MAETAACSLCGALTPSRQLAQARMHAFWKGPDGACQACVQQLLLRTLLERGEPAFHSGLQAAWPLDAEAAFGALPTRIRLHADPRFTGKGVTIALLDSGFCAHPDLIRPINRVRLWMDATREPLQALHFEADETPFWPDSAGGQDWQWHGTMTSVAAGGNGYLSHGLYSGMAPDAELVLIQVRDETGHISSESLVRALSWLLAHVDELKLGVVSMSVSGDPAEDLAGNPLDTAVHRLIEAGVCVVAAAGNDGVRQLTPPATSPFALTVGGIDDRNEYSSDELALWHSNYGNAANGSSKPELVAPSIWVAAPILPGTEVEREAAELFERRMMGETGLEQRLAELKLITPHYQHVEGTSFAAPLAGGAVACMLEANPDLTPLLVREILLDTAQPVAGAPRERQGAGALNAGRAIARALAERHGNRLKVNPEPTGEGLVFSLHDHTAQRVELRGSWNGWSSPGILCNLVEPGFWRSPACALAPGAHTYKFLLDGHRWLDDPANVRKAHDGLGGWNSVIEVPSQP
jgi:serine protease AprX